MTVNNNFQKDMKKLIKHIRNKIFILFDRFRKHRILPIYDSWRSPTYYCEYKTLLTGKWKTYQIYNEDGFMRRMIFSSSDNGKTALKCAEEFMENISNHMFIGYNNFKQP